MSNGGSNVSVVQPALRRLPARARRTGAGAPEAKLDLRQAERRRRQTIRRRHRTFRRSLALADVLAVSIALVAGAMVFGHDHLTPATLVGLLLLILVMKAIGLYDRDENLLHRTTLDEVPQLFQTASVSALVIWLVGDLMVAGDLGRRQALAMWVMLFVLLLIGRSLARYIAARVTPVERCLLLGDADSAEVFRRKLAMRHSVRAELVTWLRTHPLRRASDRRVYGRRATDARSGAPQRLVEDGHNGAGPNGNGQANGNGHGHIPQLPADLDIMLADRQIDRVVLAPGRVNTDALLHVIRRLQAMEVDVSVLPATPPVPGSAVEMDHIDGLTLLGVRGHQMSRSSRLLKRGFDLGASLLMLTLMSPLLLVIAVAIKLDSRGPVLFRQRRIGRHGDGFEMFKFRSMFDGADGHREDLRHLNEVDGLFKIEHDPRVTRVGRLMRRWSLDELPQIWNVVRGEMSLVGPRPLVPEEDRQIEGYYRGRSEITPGITGYWQALGSSRIPLDEMVRLDYLYVTNWSLWNDIRILLRTVPYVISGRGR